MKASTMTWILYVILLIFLGHGALLAYQIETLNAHSSNFNIVMEKIIALKEFGHLFCAFIGAVGLSFLLPRIKNLKKISAQ